MPLGRTRPRRSNAAWAIGTAAATLAIGLTAASASARQVMFVDDDGVPGGLGTTWNDACPDLQDALAMARQSGGQIQEIRVAAGVYRPDAGESQILGDRSAAFLIGPGTILRGGYAGLAGANPNDRDIEAYPTVLSGDLDANDEPGLGPGLPSRVDNSIHVVKSVDAGPSSLLEGFVICGGNANLAVHDFNFGGGMLIDGASPTVSYCTFTDNFAVRSGGAMAILGGSPALDHVTFSDNEARQLGGAVFSENGIPRITHSTFVDNSSDGAGGGIALLYSHAEIVNSLLVSNSAVYGGAISNFGASQPVLTNVTITRNRAFLAGGIFSSFTGPRIDNSILWNNWDLRGREYIGEIFGAATVNHSCIRGGWLGDGGVGNISADPGLDGSIDKVRLSAGSPCIDAGNNLAVPADILTDLAGNARFQDDPNSPDVGEPGNSPAATPIVDMGAFEYQRVIVPRRPVSSGPLG